MADTDKHGCCPRLFWRPSPVDLDGRARPGAQQPAGHSHKQVRRWSVDRFPRGAHECGANAPERPRLFHRPLLGDRGGGLHPDRRGRWTRVPAAARRHTAPLRTAHRARCALGNPLRSKASSPSRRRDRARTPAGWTEAGLRSSRIVSVPCPSRWPGHGTPPSAGGQRFRVGCRARRGTEIGRPPGRDPWASTLAAPPRCSATVAWPVRDQQDSRVRS